MTSQSDFAPVCEKKKSRDLSPSAMPMVGPMANKIYRRANGEASCLLREAILTKQTGNGGRQEAEDEEQWLFEGEKDGRISWCSLAGASWSLLSIYLRWPFKYKLNYLQSLYHDMLMLPELA